MSKRNLGCASHTQVKKRKNYSSLSNTCCVCQVEHSPHLLMLGCQGGHTMCHVCIRSQLSSNFKMNNFPLSNPAKISVRKDFKCPLCREMLPGISNFFVYHGDKNEEKTLDCPYKELFGKSDSLCVEKLNLNELQKHIIQKHNQSIKCGYCMEWLRGGDKMSVEEAVYKHVLHHCKKVPCNGCDRKSNTVNLYLHSSLSDSNSCTSGKCMYVEFGNNLPEISFNVENDEEMMGATSRMFLTWVFELLYFRTTRSLEMPENRKLMLAEFVMESFLLINRDISTRTPDQMKDLLKSMIMSGKTEQYETFIFSLVSKFAKRMNQSVTNLNKLSYFYRLFVMSLSGFENAELLLSPLFDVELEKSDKDIIRDMVEAFKESTVSVDPQITEFRGLQIFQIQNQ